MSKREEFNNALKVALKSQNQVAMATLRLILAALKERDIESRVKGLDGIPEGEILSLLQSMIKQRKESSKTYADAGRPELAEREDAEIKIIEGFLPRQMSESEVDEAVASAISETAAAGIKDMGKVMNALKTRYAGQMDMGKAGAVVKQKLSA
jgi:hypothetical protein